MTDTSRLRDTEFAVFIFIPGPGRPSKGNRNRPFGVGEVYFLKLEP